MILKYYVHNIWLQEEKPHRSTAQCGHEPSVQPDPTQALLSSVPQGPVTTPYLTAPSMVHPKQKGVWG